MPGIIVDLTRIPALEALADAFVTVGEDWRVSYWNAAAERCFGAAREAALGAPVWEALPAAAQPSLRARLAAVVATRAPLRVPFAAGGDGPALTLDASPLEGGGLALHFRDATDHARVAERYSRLLASIRDGFVAVDADWKVVYVNSAAETLLHVRLHKAVGASLLVHLPSEPPELAAALRGTMGDGQPRRLQAVRPGVEWLRGRYFDLSVDPLAGGGISLLFQDVTERQEREAELARLAAEAQEASRAKSRFFAAVSHELRTPLHAIVGYTHLLSTDSYGDMPQPASRAAERASVCAEHLARLIDDVLVLTTTEIDRLPVYPAPLKLAEYLNEVLEPFRRQAEAKGLRFELDAPAGLTLHVDPERLRQIVYALVTNAIKFTPRGHVRVGVRGTDGEIEIRVEDSGPGIAAEDRARIFEAFEQVGDDARTDSIHRGTGLGLTIARKLAGRLGGSLALEGGDGAGSAFVLRVPISAPE
ncbi:sensor histidine kinase [Longimicrobium sp.]|uniref:sensor histidine kinase n=1 Tax=Longimicrobium sp. TaxID=2029185 RepID=UPI002CF96598|nr:ATP-binding protein [Longimicrobium sp.]HSU15075.1 ATP-binding protein [Longimicrobium sp.]